ncbi:MAG: sugar-binding protein [Chitinispirillia bacterium]
MIPPDSSVNKNQKIIGEDSAAIISPKHLTILKNHFVDYEVQPFCRIESIVLYVNYYPSQCDTLARLKNPPFSTRWDYTDIVDHDQINLQFGYILYHQNGDTIISPPQPHHWIINRKVEKSRRKYICRQAISEEEFEIDGNLEDWSRIKGNNFRSDGNFKCAWTSANLFLAIKVFDPFVYPSDRIEIFIDMTKCRTPFLSKDHRIISFGPKTRSFSWAVELTDSGYIQLDSIIIRIDEEMEWRSQIREFGYTIETRIPFCVLSALEFPSKYIGFDVSVVNSNGSSGVQEITSWSGINPAERYNSEGWGTIILSPLMKPLQYTLIAALIVVFGLILFMVLISLLRKHKEMLHEKMARKDISPIVKQAINIIEQRLSEDRLSVDDIARQCNIAVSDLEKHFSADMDSTCKKIIVFSRIKKAKKYLLDTEWDAEIIAEKVGYKDVELFRSDFRSIAGIDVETWKDNRLYDEIDEESDEEDL